jgi:TolA-binding protein
MRPTLLVSSLLCLLLLTGCSGGADESSAGSAAARDAATTGRVARPVAETAPVTARAVVRTGSVVLTGAHLDRTIGSVRTLLREVGGAVDRADTEQDPEGRTERATLVLRVPVARFDVVMARLGRLGRLRSSTEAEKDVTTRVIDVAERVQTLQGSLDRLQRFQRSARDAGDLVRFERQITTRQSELQSLRAQQSYLADRTAMSTITLTLTRPDAPTRPHGGLDDAGFAAGLSGGWHALGDVVVVALTVLGAALPLLVLAGLLAVPTLLLVRSLRRRRAATPR